jgi:hypothetical protein
MKRSGLLAAVGTLALLVIIGFPRFRVCLQGSDPNKRLTALALQSLKDEYDVLVTGKAPLTPLIPHDDEWGQPGQSGHTQVSPSNILDVSRERPPGRPRGFGGYAVIVPHSTRPVLAPFRVTLVGLSKSAFRLNDARERLVFEVMIENTTNDSIVIPWSDDRDTVDPDDQSPAPGLTDATLALTIDDPDGGEQMVAGKLLFGSHLVPSSLKEVHPAEKVIIRAADRPTIFDGAAFVKIAAKLSRVYAVRAEFQLLSKNPKVGFKTSFSDNRVGLTLRKPR